MALSSVPDILDDIRAGKMVILMDDEDRENEGDLIIAAEAVTPEVITFFSSEACGLICMPITKERAQQLQLPLMVRDNRSQHETNFTVSIDAAERKGPGISSAQRAHTVLTAAGANAEPADISQPGHIFPLVAKPGGVLRRAGHTEAGVDLARMAGFEPAALIVEIMNEDGTMARRPQLEAFAKKHALHIGTIADLIQYRALHEQSIELKDRKTVLTDFGHFELHTFQDLVDDTIHYALTLGISWRVRKPSSGYRLSTRCGIFLARASRAPTQGGLIAEPWSISRPQARERLCSSDRTSVQSDSSRRFDSFPSQQASAAPPPPRAFRTIGLSAPDHRF